MKNDIIARAREMAARGEATYHEALDAVSRDSGFTSWKSVDAIYSGPRDRNYPFSVPGAVHDLLASLALLLGANDLERRTDFLLTRALRPVVGLLAVVGIGRSMLARLSAMAALLMLGTWISLSAVLMHLKHPIGAYADRLMLVLPIVFVADLWLMSRWLVANGDPLRNICRGIRGNALTICAFRTLFAMILWKSLTGSDLHAPAIVHFAAILLNGPAWLVAMHADVVAAETDHGW